MAIKQFEECKEFGQGSYIFLGLPCVLFGEKFFRKFPVQKSAGVARDVS